jgi:DNA-binding phage protein
MVKKTGTSFDSDLMLKLRDPKFASNYITSAMVDGDIDFLAIALGDVAKAHGIEIQARPKRSKKSKAS